MSSVIFISIRKKNLHKIDINQIIILYNKLRMKNLFFFECNDLFLF